MVMIAIYAVTALLIVVTLIGVYLVFTAIREAGGERRAGATKTGQGRPRLTLMQKIRHYEGPIDPDKILFNAPARVGIEFFTALCGFPGLGWMVSGRVLAGILMITTVPVFVWAAYPLYLSIVQPLLPSPFFPVRYLPGIAVLSAGSLAVSEFIAARRRKAEHRGGGEADAGRPADDTAAQPGEAEARS